MTDAELNAIEGRTKAATAGPWYTVDSVWLPRDCGTYVIAGHHDPHIGKPVLDHVDIDEWPADRDGPDYSQSDADLAFAAAARADVPALIAEIRRLRAALAPFAAYVDERGSAMPDDTPMDAAIAQRGPTLGHCRAAREALS